MLYCLHSRCLLWTLAIFASLAFRSPAEAQQCGDEPCMNLRVNQKDDNGFPLNPQWVYAIVHNEAPDSAAECNSFRLKTPGDPSAGLELGNCTTDADPKNVDYPHGFELGTLVCAVEPGKGPVQPVAGDACHRNDVSDNFHGHVNWHEVTLRGRLYASYDPSPIEDDGDYNFALVPVDEAGSSTNALVTECSRTHFHDIGLDPGTDAVGVEFSSTEMQEYSGSDFWQNYYQLVYDGKIADFVNNKLAVVTGLLGIDAEHDGGHSEIHPVHALAIQMQADDHDDQWAVMVRNWGNEGMCSSKQWTIYENGHPKSSISILIPHAHPSGATLIDTKDIFSNPRDLKYTLTGTADGAVFTAQLCDPNHLSNCTLDRKPMLDGLLHICWDTKENCSTRSQIMRATASNALELQPERHEGPPAKWSTLTPQQRADLLRRLAVKKSSTIGRAKLSNKLKTPKSPENKYGFVLKPNAEVVGFEDADKVQRDFDRIIGQCDFQRSGVDLHIPEDICAKARQMASERKGK